MKRSTSAAWTGGLSDGTTQISIQNSAPYGYKKQNSTAQNILYGQSCHEGERFDDKGRLTAERSRQLIQKLLSTLHQLEKSNRRAKGDPTRSS